MKLTVQIRHQQVYDINGNPVYYAGPNPNNLTAIPGIVPGHEWIDVTDYTSGQDKLAITWTLNRNTTGEETPGAFQPKKTVSSPITFEGMAFQYIKEWLWDDVAAPLNVIEVQITDTSCGIYAAFSIKNTDTDWCSANACTFDVTIKQRDALWACIQKTVISDNWQGWFQNQPKNPDGTNKYHPRFSYCVEHRPNAILIALYYILTLLYPVMLVVGLIAIVITAILDVISAIITAISLGTATPGFTNPFSVFNDIFNGYEQIYIESSGCGREQPAPLVRDYIYNVCAKCGIEVNAASAPLFFSPIIDFSTSSRGILTNQTNEYYNACYFFPQAKRGVRRATDNTTFYLPENAPILALDQFLDQLKGLFNAEWRIATDPLTGKSTLYFQRKDWFKTNAPLYDFSIGGVDADKVLYGICYQWDSTKMPAYTNGLYGTDAADTCGNEVAGANGTGQMNGLATFGYTDNNPNYEGNLDKTSAFGGTKFRYDGASTDYIFDAIQFVAQYNILNLTLIGIPAVSSILRSVTSTLADYAAYALLMSDEIVSMPKLLIWDGASYLNAKAIGTNGGKVPLLTSLSVSADNTPVNNSKYPTALPTNPVTYALNPWPVNHPVDNDTLASVVTPPAGIYQVTDNFGSIIDHAQARLINYPMYFEPGYWDTMWDRFHWIDDPRYNPSMRLTWTLQMDLCCADLKKLGVLGDGTSAKVYYPVLLPLKYYPYGVITEITVDYGSDSQLGMHIELKGNA